ncbi:ATP-binding protein [Selenomonas sp. AB3002]|uniref:ATP-binding protein n=1 Tax=Selenomonas sp. AB3002 TaxID=1392502 RepID=UPI00296FD5AB
MRELHCHTFHEVDNSRVKVPEYLDFAWLEGIVNAVTHREYAMSGNFIKVSMYDDRLEIESSGRLPNLVTLQNIKETRYSRNPRISSVMTEFGWVRELNEGVNRIYNDMAEFFLDAPVYSEPGESLRLVLKNNIVMRRMRQELYVVNNVGISMWKQLDDIEQAIMAYILNRGTAGRAQLAAYVGKSDNTVRTRLNALMDKNLIKANGGTYDPNRTYEAGALLTD